MSGSFLQPRSCRKTKGAVPANRDRQCDSTMNPISRRKEDAASSCVCPPSCVVLASAQPPSGIPMDTLCYTWDPFVVQRLVNFAPAGCSATQRYWGCCAGSFVIWHRATIRIQQNKISLIDSPSFSISH